MIEERAVAGRAAGEADGAPASKEELHRRMEEARDSIAQTVGEIKETVTDKYQSVKESVEGALDWREQFRSHPIAWLLGALSVGYVVGNSAAASFKDSKHDDRLLAHLASLGERFADELSDQGMKILTPVLSGAVLLPILVDKVGELSGIDLSDLAARLTGVGEVAADREGKGKKKKDGGKSKGKGKAGGKGKKKSKRAKAADSATDAASADS